MNKEELIQSIQQCEFERVKAFLANHPKKVQVYNNENMSSAMISLKTFVDIEKSLSAAYENDEDTEEINKQKEAQLKIYEVLIDHGLTLGPHEDFDSVVLELELRTKIELRKINKTLQEVSLKHLTMLNTKSKLAHHTIDNKRSEYNQKISRTYEELNTIKWIEPILKVAANSDELQIIFDFENDSVDNVDPTARKFTHGAVYSSESLVYIGAAPLLKDNERYEVLGHLAHELTHFAMELLYQNNTKPYKASSADQNDFEKIIQDSKSKQNLEKYISLVFTYNQRNWHSELIVRVPHLLALYKDDVTKLNELKEVYYNLFLFYETKVLIDIERELPLMEALKEIKKLNEFSGVESKLKNSNLSFKSEALNFKFDPEKVSLIQSNCPELTMKMIYQQQHSDKKSEFPLILVTLDTLMSVKLFEMTTRAFGSAARPTVIIDCASTRNKEVIALTEKLKNNNLHERIVLVQIDGLFRSSSDNFVDFKQHHFWKDLSTQAQQNLLEIPIIFQGHSIPLRDLLSLDSIALNSMPLKQLIDQSLRISREQKLLIPKFYIERKFRRPYNKSEYEFDRYEIDSDKIIEIAESFKIILLSSEPGMGKTSELKMMTKRLRSKFMTKWILFVDLKDFVENYEKDGNVTKSFDSLEEVTQFFFQKILKIKDFDEQVFTELFHLNRVIFLLDGFDEVSPSFKEFNILLIKAIREKTGNRLWISTRVHLEEDLKNALECLAFRLKPFDHLERKNLLGQLLKNKNVSDEALEKKVDDANKVLKRFASNESQVATPMLMKVITDLHDNQNFNANEANLFSVYKSFTYNTVESFGTKGSEARNEVAEYLIESTDPIGFHQLQAIKDIFMEKDGSFESLYENQVVLPNEKMARVGLMSVESDKLQFIHQTVAEFFVVDFFRRFLLHFRSESPQFQALLEIIRIVLLSTGARFTVVKGFFEGWFETLILKNNEKKSKKVKEIFKNFKPNEISFIFQESIKKGFIGTLKMIPITDNALFDEEELKKLWLEIIARDQTALMIASDKHSERFIDQLISLARMALDDESFERMFFDQAEDHSTDGTMSILSFALKNENPGIFNYFMKLPMFSMQKPVTKKMFLEFSDKGTATGWTKGNLILHALNTNDDDEKFMIFEILTQNFEDDEIKRILNSSSGHGDNILCFAAMNFTESSRDFLRLLREKFSKAELREMAETANNYDRWPLMYAAEIWDEKHFQIMWNFIKEAINDEERFKENLLKLHQNYMTTLTFASVNPNPNNFRFVLNVYKSYFDVDKMREIVSKRDYTRHSFRFSAQRWYWNRLNAGACEMLWTYMQEILDHETLSILLPHFRPYDGERDLTKITFEKAYRSTGPRNAK